LDIDESLLREAEQQARREGKSFAALIEDALRSFIEINAPRSSELPASDAEVGLDAQDPFFSALTEIRARGRVSAANRELVLD
jgi:hypothetical protein